MKQVINLLLLNNFYPVMLYRRVRKESDELLYIRFWSLVMVRNQLPTQVVKIISFSDTVENFISFKS